MRKKIRYGILGFGAFAERSIAQAIQASANSELIAIQKRSIREAQEKAKKLNIPLAFDSPQALAEHADIDAVFIGSAVVQHEQDVLTAARARKHVLVEKPMAMNVAEAERMISACQRANVKLMIAHMVRFSPLVLRIKELLRSGIIGDVVFVRAEYMYDARFSQRRWLQDKTIAGGGPSFDIGVHCLDTIRFILDDDVVSVNGQLSPNPTEMATEKTSLMALKFSREITASIYCSFLSPIRRAFLEIIGQEGILSAENFPMVNLTVPLKIVHGHNNAIIETKEESIIIPNLYEKEISAFSDSLLNDTPLPIPGEEGLKNQIVLDEILKGI